VVERRSGLGRGLAALIPSEGAAGGLASLQELPVTAVEPNPNQPRIHFDEESLADLAASIRELGVLQPILVRVAAPGRYWLIAGERRWRAARRAGLDTIPAIVRDTDEVGSIEQALVENLHRQDLTALEEASAYQQLIEDFELTHDDVATRVGKSRVAITNRLRLLGLPPAIQHLLADGRLTAGHARALLGTPDRGFQESLARRAVADHLSVRAVEEAVRAHVNGTDVGDGDGDGPKPPGGGAPRQRLRPPGLLELEELLSDYLDTRVSVTMGSSKGKLVVEFATLEDLERIYRLVTEVPEPH
jgi:ParB family chromosome partitioning protein